MEITGNRTNKLSEQIKEQMFYQVLTFCNAKSILYIRGKSNE